MDTPTPSAPEPMTMGARLLNVFVAPGEVFEACARVPVSWMNWVVTSVILSILGVILQWALFSDPTLMQEVRTTQERALDEMVAKGRMTREQAEQSQKMWEGPGVIFIRVAAAVAAATASWIVPFWWGLLLWVVGRWVFRSPMTFGRGVEIAALSGLINGLGAIVTFFLAFGLGRLFAGPHLGMLVSDFNPANRLHMALANVNLFGVWNLLVMTVGLAKVVERPFKPVAIVLMGVWFGYKVIAVVAGLGQMSL